MQGQSKVNEKPHRLQDHKAEPGPRTGTFSQT